MEFNNNGVSVICLVYNMEKYLRNAFDSFVMQKVNFPLEVIVHDDASTDGSADIIREYASKYPDLFVPVLQTENQYSRNIPITPNFIFPRVRGKYIAMCEGDDYWTDPLKLQKQYDFLESHPDYSFCAHAARRIDISGRTPDKIIGPMTESGTVETADIIYRNAQGMYVTANSMMYPFEYARTKPEDMKVPKVGDKPMVTWLATKGPMYFFGEEMSVYRYNHPTSWTSRNHFAGDSKKIALFKSYLPIYPAALRYMDGENRDCIEKSILLILRRLMAMGVKFSDIKSGEMKEYYDMLSSTRQKELMRYRWKAPLRHFRMKLAALKQQLRAIKHRKSSADR